MELWVYHAVVFSDSCFSKKKTLTPFPQLQHNPVFISRSDITLHFLRRQEISLASGSTTSPGISSGFVQEVSRPHGTQEAFLFVTFRTSQTSVEKAKERPR